MGEHLIVMPIGLTMDKNGQQSARASVVSGRGGWSIVYLLGYCITGCRAGACACGDREIYFGCVAVFAGCAGGGHIFWRGATGGGDLRVTHRLLRCGVYTMLFAALAQGARCRRFFQDGLFGLQCSATSLIWDSMD